MKTLYISDLDGTLLRSSETTSDYTNDTINRLTEQGMVFSYATARSFITAKKVTKGLNAKIPLIVYNGVFIIDNVTGEIISSHYFDTTIKNVFQDLFYEKYSSDFHCVYQRDIYSGQQWLEIMPKDVSKASAVVQLKTLLHCDKVVAFGDGINDLEMFKIADECYAVQNAADELKKQATAVIAGNNEDGVAKWLESNFCVK